MKKILLSLFTVGVVAVVALVATQAFFNDTETSVGNVLQAGALDLRIDNTCYYNGNACTPVLDDNHQPLGYSTWNGLPDGERCSCTWGPKDLSEGDLFFNLRDLKPGDWEEDTISIDVDNPSWLCADLKVTKDDDNTCTEPETTDETAHQLVCAPGNKGELAQNLHFVFWSDDGDNVFEVGEREKILTQGTADQVLNGVKWALADSAHGSAIGPKTYYIGKFFCFGTIGLSPLEDGNGSPVDRKGSGFTCDGKPVDNQSQTDVLIGDVSFYAEQARHNEGFLCNPPTPTPE